MTDPLVTGDTIVNIATAWPQGRGKGGKGLGLGNARHRRNVIGARWGISKGSIRRLARRGGVTRISGLIYDETRHVLDAFLRKAIGKAVLYTELRGAKTVTGMDVAYGLKQMGRPLYMDFK